MFVNSQISNMSAVTKFLLKKETGLSLWFGLSLFAALKQALVHHFNNYLIYKFTFFNLTHQHNLYSPQPTNFLDVNHYGPLFALFIAPFVWMPDQLAVVVWVMFNACILYQAIVHLPLSEQHKTIVILLCAHELMTASYNAQFNPCMAAIILGSFILIKNKNDFWAACLIVLGTYIKLYGIVGLAFFFFSDQKTKLVLGLIFWGVIFFLLPMAISSPHFVIQTYVDWKNVLIEKDAQNAASLMQDISVMGLIRRIFHLPNISDAAVLLPALALFGSSYLFLKKYKLLPFQLLILSSTLLFTVLFSSGSESPTYIIAFAGVAIWFVNLPKPVTNFQIALLIFAFILTSLSPSDIFPKFIKTQYVVKYALKALPCFLIWLHIVYETWTRHTVFKAEKMELAV